MISSSSVLINPVGNDNYAIVFSDCIAVCAIGQVCSACLSCMPSISLSLILFLSCYNNMLLICIENDSLAPMVQYSVAFRIAAVGLGPRILVKRQHNQVS